MGDIFQMREDDYGGVQKYSCVRFVGKGLIEWRRETVTEIEVVCG